MTDRVDPFNSEALANQENGGSSEFHAKTHGSEPLQTGGHQPGRLVGNDAKSEFAAQVLPPGTAPADRTFQPKPDLENPPIHHNTTEIDNDAPRPRADDFPGATSADVHTGLGKPVQGQSSAELRHDGQSHNKSPGAGIDGLKSGASGGVVDARDPEFQDQRALNKDGAIIGNTAGGAAAQDRVPETAETVAREN